MVDVASSVRARSGSLKLGTSRPDLHRRRPRGRHSLAIVVPRRVLKRSGVPPGGRATVDHRDMGRPFILACVVTAAAAGLLHPAPAAAQNTSPLAGVWTLDRSLSEWPREIGFNVDWVPPSSTGQNAGSSGGGRGRR